MAPATAPAPGVVVKNVVTFDIVRSMVEKFGGDSMTEMLNNYRNYIAAAASLAEQSC